MKIIPNNTCKIIGNLAQGCVVKPEIVRKPDIQYYYSRASHDEYYWIRKRQDKEIAALHNNKRTFHTKYTDIFDYRKNYTTITREDFFKNKHRD